MKMTCKIVFDPLDLAPKDIIKALEHLTVTTTFHNHRDEAPAKPKAAKS